MSFDFLTQRTRIITEHRKIILAMRAIETKISVYLKQNDSSWRDLDKERNVYYGQIEPLMSAYWNILPAVELSCCPICQQKLFRRFDAVDLNGFWWMDRTQRPCEQPKACDHFLFLTGALNLNGKPVSGGLFECLPGPDVPFVIPRILEAPVVKAVMSCMTMQCGYLAFPIAYFSSEKLSPNRQSHEWAQKVLQFQSHDGQRGWDIKDEVLEYNLATWIKSDKLLGYFDGHLTKDKDDPTWAGNLQRKGQRRLQVIVDNQMRFR